PGIFRDFLAEDGHVYDAIELDEGEPLPGLDGYEALWVMGGPMDTWQEDAHPWLKDEKAFIREAVAERGLPYLGLCLGHQLLADALGGEVGPSDIPEIGVLDVQLTEVGASGVIFDGLPERFPCLQWHSAEVKKMPAGASCLATSPDCAVQAMKWETRAFSAQFHIEVEADTVDNWSEIPEYADALNKAFGDEGVAKLKADVDVEIANFNKMAERLYINWLQMTAQT
ncbi:MAG: type 1 glutamine amidotransferase, partial [Boseongicola sp.]|nr:type 1 glutamine amidotransferase [Boseongicola sp.]